MPLFCAVVFGFCLVGFMVALWPFLCGEPFQLTIRPVGDRSVVQFVDQKNRRRSPEFLVETVINESCTISLASDDVLIPDGSVAFSDTTILPGRFKLQIGDTHIDVMESVITIDGRPIDWQVN